MMCAVLLSALLLLPIITCGSAPSRPPPKYCRRCCDHLDPPLNPASPPPANHTPEIRTFINMTILKGEKGDRGDRGTAGKAGGDGPPGLRGEGGLKGSKGARGAPGDSCKIQRSSFSVGRRKPLHSAEYYQPLTFDTVFVNPEQHFNTFKGKFYCSVPGVYFFNLNIHTWNLKETYLHLMHNEGAQVILYAQPSERSIMQSQSLLLPLQLRDEVWVRLYKRQRDNAIYSDNTHVYVTFNGHLVAAQV